MRTDLAYLEDIYIAARDAQDCTVGLEFEIWVGVNELRRAVVNCLHEIGEASKKLSQDFKQQHPEIPWDELTSHRNALAHEYFRIDYGQVWRVVHDVLPLVIEKIRPLIPSNLGQ
jgi:uncharacterized protein with HEPN domain